MSTLKVNTINAATSGQAVAVDVQNPRNNRNLIINGGMQVWQRSTSTASVGSADTYIADRFRHVTNGAARYTVSKNTDVPAGYGFSNSMKLDCTTVNANSAANFVSLEYRIEGQDLQRVCKGTAQAKKLTLSFHVKSPKTGVHVVELFDNDTGSNRHCSMSYTISSANTWQKIELTFPADTTGAFDNDNNASLRIFFWMAAGSDYSSGTLAASWAAFTSANRAVGQVNCFDNTSNDFYITGVQLEVLEYATDFEHRTYGDELAKCQRYCNVLAPGAAYSPYPYVGFCESSSTAKTMYTFPVTMRAAPSTVRAGTFGYDGASSNPTINSSSGYNTTSYSRIEDTISSGTTGEGIIMININDASAKVFFDAEL